MREVTRNFIVGLTSILALLSLATLLMFFGELAWVTEPRYPLRVLINDAGGLLAGNTVFLDGVRIGAVERVTLSDDPEHPVLIEAMINAEVRVPVDVHAGITVAMIAGSSTLTLSSPQPAPGRRPEHLATDGSGTIIGRHQSLVDQLTAKLDERMAPLLEALQGFQSLGDTYGELGRNLNDLVRPQTGDELAGGDKPNLRAAVGKLNAALDNAGEALRLATEWLSDEQLRTDARAAVTKANLLIDKATAAVERYTALAETFHSDGGALLKKLLPVADQLDATLSDVRRISQAALSGRGTIAQLLTNPDLYLSLNDAAVRLEQALTEAKLLMQKIKSEGLPIDF
jgi:phospholipid/cholesterol/gamma-HCH transport system substrate-binding protein